MWSALPDPTCQASLVRHPDGTLFFGNPASSQGRLDFTVRASKNDGKTWNAGRLIDPRPSAYSCLAVLKNGDIGVLYETGDKSAAQTLTFARFAPTWITEAPTVEGN